MSLVCNCMLEQYYLIGSYCFPIFTTPPSSQRLACLFAFCDHRQRFMGKVNVSATKVPRITFLTYIDQSKITCLFVLSPNSGGPVWKYIGCPLIHQANAEKEVILVTVLCFFPVTKSPLTPWSLCMRWQKLVRGKSHNRSVLFLECKSVLSFHPNTIDHEVTIEWFYWSPWGSRMLQAMESYRFLSLTTVGIFPAPQSCGSFTVAASSARK